MRVIHPYCILIDHIGWLGHDFLKGSFPSLFICAVGTFEEEDSILGHNLKAVLNVDLLLGVLDGAVIM